MKGPKTFEEWVAIYKGKDSDTEYVLSPGEQVVFDPMHGFFTYSFDPETREILIPKMCGDGKYWRKLIYEMVLKTKTLGVKGVYCCSKANPAAYMRILGGRLVKMEHTYDFRTGKETTLWYFSITPENTKEKGGASDVGGADTADADSGLSQGLACQGGRLVPG